MRTFVRRVSDDLIGSARRRDWRGATSGAIDVLTFLMALAAGASLVARYGFFLDARLQRLAERIGDVVLYGFLVQAGLKLLLARSRLAYLREHAVDMAAVLLLLLLLLFPGQIGAALRAWNPFLTPDALANIYVAITQASLIVAFIPSAARASKRAMSAPLQPSLLIAMSFLLLVLIGTGALLLPRATTTTRISLIDALFTATSAGCVTGLTVVDTGSFFSPLGKLVILLLIQVGGLGIMTFTTFFAAVMSGRGSLKEYATLQALFGEQNLTRIRGVVAQIALTTLGFELAGTILLHLFTRGIPFDDAYGRLFFCVFHAVSAFCNAGFSLLSANLADPLLYSNAPALCTVMVLIVCGGLGFPVLRNIAEVLLPRRRGSRRHRLSLQSRIVLTMTTLLIVLGAAAFALLEAQNALRGEGIKGVILHGLFQSVTARTAGFNTVDMGILATPTAFLLIALMWIGASPGSTGGGIKTTSLALLVSDALAVMRGKDRVEIGRARIDSSSVSRAHATALVSLLLIAAAFFVLTLTDRAPVVSLLFEVFSAAGTVGLSAGITPALSTAGKAVLVVLMFVGRVGFLTVAMALTPRARVRRVDYAAESVPVL